jgi:diguanylate cyclase (GGDEF)-like protein/excisionase family DNA binding protein
VTFWVLPIPPEATTIEARHEAAILSVTGAARLLGVHPNTVRAWTDQGRLRCLRINERGDRRYRTADLQAFLHEAGLQSGPLPAFGSRISRDAPDALLRPRPVDALAPITSIAPTPLALPAGPSAQAVPAPITSLVPGGFEFADPAVPLGERSLVTQIRDALISQEDLLDGLREAASTLLEGRRFRSVAIQELRAGTSVIHLVAGAEGGAEWAERVDPNLIAVCIREGQPVSVPTVFNPKARGQRPPQTVTVCAPIGTHEHPWGVIIAESGSDQPLSRRDLEQLQSVATTVEVMAHHARLLARLEGQKERAESVARITAELNSELELSVLMRRLADEAATLFQADRTAVWRLGDGQLTVDASHNLSDEYIETVRSLSHLPIGMLVAAQGSSVVIADAANDPRASELRDGVLREGFHTVALSGLTADGAVIGLIAVYHDQPHDWPPEDLEVLTALARHASIAIKNAKNYELMAVWAAQLQSIQQLGTRLNRWGSVTGIGQAIAAELRQLIDYHNVRVYRVRGDAVEPVAWRGEIGEYTAEEREQLRLRVGEGITGWVAQNGIPQYLPDAANDPRSQTIPGTEDDLDESMLIAPMLYEDQVLGVIVLSKLGLHQFTGDDLRYLEIYASIAAQAMVNADATEQLKAQSDRLAHQLSSQRELMQVTESILSTLDPRSVVEEIADRLSGLLSVDNVAIGVHDPESGLINPLFARGVDAERYMTHTIKDSEGLSGWVVRNGEAQLVQNALTDPRVVNFEGPINPGALIVAPLRSRDKVTGVLLLERIGEDARFEDQEFELIQLFAGHVSIALQNAQAHQAVEIRAQTDALTGLKNQGTFQEYLQVTVTRGNPFSLLIVDLDDFKAFNDRRGHEAGNVLLAQIAKGLRASCRDSDEVFRYGGDEFALILPNTDELGAMEVAAKVGRAVRTATAPGSRKASGVTCSVGVAAFPSDASDRESILLAADRACYVAKRHGRNRAVTAAEALALAGDVLPEGPTPVDDPQVARTAA